MCLGKDMAYIQMKALVASILERFDVEVAEERRQPRHQLTFTMRMEGGLPVTMKALAACILEKFDVELAAERGRHQLSMTMRMEGGLPVRVKSELRPNV
ncbi:hypothetical protein OPV22_028573 [Ensete ventricosum]|uniref:Cytochrome P450 n=1 Tax=Ensete ventricosum TaxID=4639 RepID=A0AAV8P577_ENSVE|nr:hypothetical protein OPV22_028573 [Ensete ventricosum]